MTTATAPVLQHPGPRHPLRHQVVTTTSATVASAVRPGAKIIDALAEVVQQTGSDCAQIELMGGTFDRISYCVPAIGTGRQPVTFSETREATVPAQLLNASITFGYRGGQRHMHCHAMWLDADGVLRGGHLWADSVFGAVAPYAVVHTLPGVTMINDDCRETMLPTFTPVSGKVAPPAPTSGHTRAVICRILPGEDITEASEKVCQREGITHGLIRGSVGSLVGARLHRSGGDHHLVDGPATEVIALAGSVRPDTTGSLRADISAVMVDRHGQVEAGPLVRSLNPVAVTFELLIIDEQGK